ncbi:MAG: hypothetical protein COU81_03455 [Candidatus Portnoybacteria bacterium CG10_big_fil_rev_8_21_14_0_10_36_7]|uniref:O-antigen ligase-related domain-containing protein n=1 Tax=Candidatus Portnoybacteria bacterium CG10_big_fil_rev_8_21_14_0_10_36_7 TaxID=1974812 RepID=A0A2M8KDD2_9BACT|nr:MAG: hypothetical protein COU81_03455 [Candidatus Portnoybacteria bacterium CG10_big_fil_rev_8_21_14_0_10_36_7]
MNREKIFYNIVKFGLLGALFIPLYIGKSLIFPFVVPKTMAFVILVELLLVFYLPLIISFPQYRPKINIGFSAITVLFFVVVLTSLTGVNVYRSIWSTYERMNGLFVFTHYYLFFIMLSGVIRSRKDAYFLMRGAVIVGLIMSLYGIGQKLGVPGLVETGVARVGGTIGNPIFLAAFLMFSYVFSMILLFDKSESMDWKYIYGISLFLNTIAIFYTGSRGVIVSMFGATFLYSMLYVYFQRGSNSRKYFIYILVAIAVFAGSLYLFRNSNVVKNVGVLNRISSIYNGLSEIQARLYAWNIGFEGFKEKPWLGWGPENYNVVYNKYFNPLTVEGTNSEVWFDRAHNIVFQWATDSGILGLLAYIIGTLLLPLYLLFGAMKRRDKDYHLYSLLFVFLIAYFLQNFFVFEMMSSYMMFFTIIAVILFFVHGEEKDGYDNKETKKLRKNSLGNDGGGLIGWTIFFGIIVLFMCVRVHAKIIDSAYWTGQAMQVGFESARDQSKVSFATVMGISQKSLSNNLFGDAESISRLVNYVSKMADNLAYSSNVTQAQVDEIIGGINFAISETKKSNEQYPLDVRYYLDLSRLYTKLAIFQSDKKDELYMMANEAVDKAIALSPRRQQVYFEQSNLKLMQGKNQEAIDILNHVIDLNSKFADGYWNKSLVLANMGEWDESAVAIDEAIINRFNYESSKIYLMFMRDVYIQAKKYDRLISVYQSLIKVDPLTLDWYIGLAESFYADGEKNKAIDAAKNILNINADSSAQVDELLKKFK